MTDLVAEVHRQVNGQGWHPQECAQSLDLDLGEVYRLLAVAAGAVPDPRESVSPMGDTEDQHEEFPEPVDPAAVPNTVLPNIPEEFWHARESLGHIRQAAHSRGMSADLVLHAVMARLSAMLDPNLRFDVGLGPGSLNYFTAVVGGAGQGKSAGGRVARELLEVPDRLTRPAEDGQPYFHDGLPLGSGEGIPEAFMGTVNRETGEVDRKGEPKKEKVRTQIRHNVFLSVDEGESLTKTAERSGATIGPTIRSAWVGELLGQANASEERRRIVHAGTYSLGMLVGYQPETAGPLLADGGAGTPQRFGWCSASDPSVPERRVEHPGPLQIPALLQERPWTDTMPADGPIQEETWSRRMRLVHGTLKIGPLDSHEPYMRGKAAALLAILDGRGVITVDDWALSKILWDTSCAVRDALIARGAAEAARKREERTQEFVDRAARAEVATSGMHGAVKRIAERLSRKVDEDGGLTNSAAWRCVAHRDRQRGGKELFEAALDYGDEHSLFRRGEHGLAPRLRAV